MPGKSHGRRSLLGCSPWGHKESDMTERLHFHFSLSCIGEGNGNPLQCSCLENTRDGGAWWAAIYGVAHSQTRLKRLSSSSSSNKTLNTCRFFFFFFSVDQGFQGSVGKKSACNAGDTGFDSGFDSSFGKISSSRRKWQSIPVYLPGKSHGQRSLVGYSPKGCKEW